jgi:hypothetical protein
MFKLASKIFIEVFLCLLRFMLLIVHIPRSVILSNHLALILGSCKSYTFNIKWLACLETIQNVLLVFAVLVFTGTFARSSAECPARGHRTLFEWH